MSVGAEAEKYLRIISISIAGYDYLITIPAELRFYRSQASILRPSLGCILFFLIRYVSVVVMVISNYGVLATTFTPESCNTYYLLAPFFKVFQTMISQVILGVRTFNIARRQRTVGILLVIVFVITTALEWFTNMYNRLPVVNNGSCTPGNDGPIPTAWLYYVVSMVWDSGTMVISTIYLLRANSTNARLGRLIRAMIYDGLGYFLILTASNVFNLVLYRANDEAVQSAGASLGYVVTWIMSQRILIHLRELSQEPELARFDNIILAGPLHPGRPIIAELRSQCELQKTPIDLEYSPSPSSPRDLELDVRVQVERSVAVEYGSLSKARLIGDD